MFINIGFGNMVNADRVIAAVSPETAPIKRLVQDAKDINRVIDVTCGRRTRSVIITDSDHIILSAIQCETITNRLSETVRLSANESDLKHETEEETEYE